MEQSSDLKQLISNATTLSTQLHHSILEPEHVLKVMLDDKSLANKISTKDKRTMLITELDNRLNTFYKIANYSVPQVGARYSKLLQIATSVANQMGDKALNVDHLLISLLEDTAIQHILEKVGIKKQDVVNRIINPTVDNEIANFAVEMVQQARNGEFDPVLGRAEEIRLMVEILSKKNKANPLLVGLPGVGKTAIVNALAQLIAEDKIPTLKDFKIYNLDVGALVANTSFRGAFEERFKALIKEAESDPKVIVYIDEMHVIVSAGAVNNSSLDAANMLKPSLASGKIKCIGSTTFHEYRKYIENDQALARRFVQITVNEPSIDDSITILRGLRERFEAHHGVRIADDALVFAVKSSKKYIPNRRLPDIAIDLIDTACSSAVVNLESESQPVIQLKEQIWSAELELTALKIDYNREKTEILEKRIKDVEQKIENLKNELIPLEQKYDDEKKGIVELRSHKQKLEKYNKRLADAERERDHYTALEIKHEIIPHIEKKIKELEEIKQVVTSKEIAEVISRWTKIPVSRLTIKENERLLQMRDRIKNRVFGQDSAIENIVEAITRSRVGLSDANKPIGSFLFLGPTGTGKTELAKAISYELFDSDKNMVILDMSDYMNEMSVTKLVGAPAGYIGYEEGGTLTEPVKHKPYNVILLDEINLANQKILNILYQLLDEGRVVDGKRNTIDFTNTVIIMTSNIGQHQILNSLGNLSEQDKKDIETELLSTFGHALLNRIDSVVYFNPLHISILENIFDYQLTVINKRLQDKNMVLTVDDNAKTVIINNSYSTTYGARPLKRNMEKILVSAVTNIILRLGPLKENEIVNIKCTADEVSDGYKIGDFYYEVNK